MQKTKKKFKLGPLQTKWLNALKSGKFRKTEQSLCARDDSKHLKYCCLGVLCKINDRPKTMVDNAILFDDSETSLQLKFAQSIGLKDTEGSLRGEPSEEYIEKHDIFCHTSSLADINDSTRDGFNPIIELMETQPEIIFNKSV